MSYESWLLLICLVVSCGLLWTFAYWITRVETSLPHPACRPRVLGSDPLTPCDFCGHAEGRLLYCGWWIGDGFEEGVHVGEEVPVVLCRHCREQVEAEITEHIESKVRVLAE